jgi:uncharacterized protein (TIGR02391 family)
MSAIPEFDLSALERLCEVLADTSSGLTGGEIGKLLAQLGIDDPLPGMTKRVRLFEALKQRQQLDRCGNLVVAFIHEAMKPVRHTGSPGWFESKRDELNKPLAFVGFELGEDGRLKTRTAAKTLTEAEQKANRLRAALERRGVHGDVLRFCRAELLQDNYFHAVLEATKSVADKIRAKTDLKGDGAELADEALALGKTGMPFLAFNSLRTESEQSEQKGLLNLMKGLFRTFRNPTAHAPKISWNMTEQDALDLLTMASFLHRRLDSAARTPRTA